MTLEFKLFDAVVGDQVSVSWIIKKNKSFGPYVLYVNHSKNERYCDRRKISDLAGLYYFWPLYLLIVAGCYIPIWFRESIPDFVGTIWNLIFGQLYSATSSFWSWTRLLDEPSIAVFFTLPIVAMSPWLIFRWYSRKNRKKEIYDLIQNVESSLALEYEKSRNTATKLAMA